MSYAVGDKVIYPHRGAGTVTGVQHLNLVEGFEEYYVIDIPASGLRMHVPVAKADDLGVRPVASKGKVHRVLSLLGQKPGRLPDDYKVRQVGIREKLASGRTAPIAEALRDLTWREEQAYLTRVDRRLLEQAREFLAAEVALITDSDVDEAQQVIDMALAKGLDQTGVTQAAEEAA